MFCLILPVTMLLFDVDVKTDSISGILGLLVGIAGAIFTIMSIWVAFLYPNVLKTLKGENLVNADFSAGGEDTARLKEIISVIVQSALTMIFSILTIIATSVVQSFPFNIQCFINHAIEFILIYFSGLQVCALISTILINISFIGVLDRQRKKRATEWDT